MVNEAKSELRISKPWIEKFYNFKIIINIENPIHEHIIKLPIMDKINNYIII